MSTRQVCESVPQRQVATRNPWRLLASLANDDDQSWWKLSGSLMLSRQLTCEHNYRYVN
jgi:hypothetical protein